MHQDRQQSAALRLYNKYQYLAAVYANKIYNHDHIGMDYDDVVQEFKMKIWHSIIKFGKRWRIYRETGNFKPVPLEFFLRGNLSRLIIDMTKRINSFYIDRNGEKQERIKGVCSMQEIGFDMGREIDPMTTIDFNNKKLIVNGIDLLRGLDEGGKKAFILYIKGHTFKNIKNLSRDVIDPVGKIKEHVRSLELIRDELGSENRLFKVFSYSEEEN